MAPAPGAGGGTLPRCSGEETEAPAPTSSQFRSVGGGGKWRCSKSLRRVGLRPQPSAAQPCG
eukprot:7599643-Pyramimonas_sp.AAC.1